MGFTKWLDDFFNYTLPKLIYGSEVKKKDEVKIEDVKKEFDPHYKINQYNSE